MIVITTAEELNDIRNNLGANYQLANNIDLSSIANWTPIGTLTNPFTGRLDGNGYTISNLTINRPTENNIGLFGVCNAPKSKYAPVPNAVLSEPIFKNIKLEQVNIKGQDLVGGLAGKFITDIGKGNDYRINSNDYGFLCDNISVSGNVSGRNYIGGLIGKIEGAPYAGHGPDAPASNAISYMVWDFIIGLRTVNVTAGISGIGNYIGGVAGHSTGVRFLWCKTSGNINGGNYLGGIAGGSRSVTYQYCSTSGDVSGNGYIAGGICGMAEAREDFKNCISLGNVHTTGYHSFEYSYNETSFSRLGSGTGGIVGVWGEINFLSYCCSYGDITGERAGGLVGSGQGGSYASANISSSFSRGDVRGFTCSGSIMGIHFASGGGMLQLSECYSLGRVQGGKAGAVIGHKGPVYDPAGSSIPIHLFPKYEGSITYQSTVLVNGDRNTASTANGGLKRTEEQLRSINTYKVAWPQQSEEHEMNGKYSFWVFDANVDLFPVLKWLHKPRTTMLSSIFSRTMGLVLGYSQTSLVGSQDLTKKVYLRRFFNDDWGNEQEVAELAGSDARINLFKTRDGKIGVISGKDNMLHMVATGTGSMAISESQTIEEMNTKGAYGGITQTSDAGARLVHFIPSVNTLAYTNTTYTGSWKNSDFINPSTMLSGITLSFLRVKDYISQSIISYRSNGKHHILFPDIPWNESPALPIPNENDLKFKYVITVLNEGGEPVENAEVSVIKPYHLGTETEYTDENGQAEFELWALKYQISVSKHGYFLNEDLLYVTNIGTKTYTLYALKSNVTFNVVGEDVGQLENAEVDFNRETKTTNSAGQTVFYDVPLQKHIYNISHDGFVTLEDEITIHEVYQTLNPTLYKPRGMAIFMVIDADTLEPIEEARVQFESSVKYTDVDGIANFADIKYGIGYVYSISADNYVSINNDIDIDSGIINIPIQMSVVEEE